MAKLQDEQVRLQITTRPEQVRIIEALERKLGIHSRATLLWEAISCFYWVVQEILRGRRVVSVAPEEIDKLKDASELLVPSLANAPTVSYNYLVARPHPWRRQLSLKGRNMTVGQLVATMNANHMTPEEAADDFEMPLEQIREALQYFEANEDLVNTELREDKRYLAARGYRVEPPALPR